MIKRKKWLKKILKEWKEERNASGLTSKKAIKELAREFKASEPTILKWKKRENPYGGL